MKRCWVGLWVGVVAGCASTPAAAPSSGPGFILGEAVVVLHDGTEPPLTVGDKSCEPVSWGSKTTVLLRCSPVGSDPEDTLELVRQIAQLPGVESVSPNMVRKKVE